MKTLRKKIALFMGALTSVFFIAALSAPAAYADDTQPLKAFIGEWQSNGDAFGKPAISTISWQPAFNGKFIRLDYAINSNDSGTPTPVFSGTAYYKHKGDNQFTAFWADSQGSLHPVEAKLTDTPLGTAIISHWGSVDTEQGRTRYTLTQDGNLHVTDWVRAEGTWRAFNENTYTRISGNTAAPDQPQLTEQDKMEKVTGIGGVFFRAKNTEETAQWYKDNLGIDPAPTDYDTLPWQQEAGSTVYAPFAHDTEYFGEPSQQWMINFRVKDLDAIVAQIRANGTEVDIDPAVYPNGRFARTADPAGTPIQLWQPAGN